MKQNWLILCACPLKKKTKWSGYFFQTPSASFRTWGGFYLDRIDGRTQTRPLANRLDSTPKDSIRVDWLLFQHDREWIRFHKIMILMQTRSWKCKTTLTINYCKFLVCEILQEIQVYMLNFSSVILSSNVKIY